MENLVMVNVYVEPRLSRGLLLGAIEFRDGATLGLKVQAASRDYDGGLDFVEILEEYEMEGAIYSSICNGTQIDGKVLQTFQKSFVQVQDILDQNRLLINEINQNHESKIPDNLSRNVGLIKELNSNIRRVVDLYGDLSHSFTKTMEASSEGESARTSRSDGKTGQKRIRSG